MKMMVLLTDFGQKDEYVGVMKGVIKSINPDASIVDLCHEISPQDIIWAGFVVYKSYKYFPKGTIFVCVVDPGVGTERDIIILKTESHYFIAPDNGLLSLVFKEARQKKIIEVNKDKFSLKPTSSTFHGRDIFAPVAGYLSRDRQLNVFGEVIQKVKIVDFPRPLFKKDKISACVIHIDRFGNLITNLERKDFQKLNWPSFKIFVKDKIIKGVVTSYSGSEELVALWESRDLLEIASPNKSAAELLNIGKGEVIKLLKEIV